MPKRTSETATARRAAAPNPAPEVAPPTVLVVEDDAEVASGIAAGLEQDGLKAVVVESGEKALAELGHIPFDAVVLDLWLPGIDGFEVITRLRSDGHAVPVLCVTARSQLPDRVRGLGLGADDYLIKPFALPELVARVRALLRRAQARAGKRVVHGSLEVDYTARRAFLNGALLPLAEREWRVLSVLVGGIGKTVSRESIVDALVDGSETVSAHAIEIYVSKLRSRLEPAGLKIRAIRGYGYLMVGADAP
jgi:two-component system OmpR family response regulator